MRVTEVPDEADKDTCAIVVTGVRDAENPKVIDFMEGCVRRGLTCLHLRVPYVVGTGMGGVMMRMARGVSQGTVMRIKDNETEWSVIHATDVASAAKHFADKPSPQTDYVVSASPVKVNELVTAFGVRIKNKHIGSLSRRWARLLSGKSLYQAMVTDQILDTRQFATDYPEFVFANPVVYLETHDYGDDSL
ncbi:MAG: hypothetical protein J1F20_01605 [Muribaculaceae bacterium]|nr:hypothetical protein [Muribaculaceae bacterium]